MSLLTPEVRSGVVSFDGGVLGRPAPGVLVRDRILYAEEVLCDECVLFMLAVRLRSEPCRLAMICCQGTGLAHRSPSSSSSS